MQINSKLRIGLFVIALILGLVAIVYFFIPAFAGKILVSPTINLGPLMIRWYGLIMGLGILSSYLVARKNSWKFGIGTKDVDDYAFWTVIIGILGARIFFVVFTWDFYSANLNEIYKIWHGGLAIYGAIIASLVFTYFYARKKVYRFWHLFDLIALCLPLGQAIGRFGNFFNQEAYGTVTELPWKMYVKADNSFHHPAFLYESILDIVIFVILFRIFGKTKPGTIGLTYLLLYSTGRFFIEGIRLDSLVVSGFRVSQVVAFLVILVSGILILRIRAKN